MHKNYKGEAMLNISGAEEKMLFDRFDKVTDKLEQAARRAGRSTADITLVAISKGHGVDKLYSLGKYWLEKGGQPVFGENYVNEALEKQEAFYRLHHEPGATYKWHFTGHLQRNKAKQICNRFVMLHTVDSLDLAHNLQKELVKRCENPEEVVQQQVLIQVNIGEEPQKYGVPVAGLQKFFERLQVFETLDIQGLMCLPPFDDNAENTRKYFVKLRQLRDALEQCFGKKLPHLSMGMSHDFEKAIEEGATIVRVGTDIFGERTL